MISVNFLRDILRIQSVIHSDWCNFLNDWEMIAKITDILDNCEKYRIYDKKFLLHVQQTNYPLTENDKCCMHNFLILEQLL